MSKLSLKCLNKIKFFLNWVLKFLGRDISWKGDMKKWKNNISRSSNYSSEIYQKWDCLIYLAWVITRARYIKCEIVWYILLEWLLERDISKVRLFDISRSSNYSSKIYQKWIWLKYLAWVITRARYIESGIVWYISLK